LQPWPLQQELVPGYVGRDVSMQTQAIGGPFSARSLSLPHVQNEELARQSVQGLGAASSDVPSPPMSVFRSPFAQGALQAPGPEMAIGQMPLPATSFAPPSGPTWQGSFRFPGTLPLPPQMPRQQDAGEGWAATDARLLGASQELPMMPILPPSGEASSPPGSAVRASTDTAQEADAEAEPDLWEALFGSGDGARTRKTLN
jgi:hypothetical protein